MPMAIIRIHDLLNLMVWIFCRAAYSETPDSLSSCALAAVPAPQLHMYLSPSRNSPRLYGSRAAGQGTGDQHDSYIAHLLPHLTS